MRTLAILLVSALAAGGCGWFEDWDPREREVFHSVPAGEEIEDSQFLGGRDDDGYSTTETVRWLPAGFEYETESLFIDEFYDELWVAYEIDVAHWVTPGIYEFRVDYEIWESVLGPVEEYQLHFTVRVLPPSEGPGPGDLTILATSQAERVVGSGAGEDRPR